MSEKIEKLSVAGMELQVSSTEQQDGSKTLSIEFPSGTELKAENLSLNGHAVNIVFEEKAGDFMLDETKLGEGTLE